jgi:hypothetical protein
MTTTNKANLLVAVLTLALAARAQTSRGTVTGTVFDPTGAVIGGARVSLTGVDTRFKLSTESNDAGVYRFDAVELGVYQLQVAQPGFRTYLGAGMQAEARHHLRSALPGPDTTRRNGGRGQLGHERPGKYRRPILD